MSVGWTLLLVGDEADAELRSAFGEERLNRCLQDFGKQEGIVERRSLLTRFPARYLGAGPMPEKMCHLPLRKVSLLSVAPETIRHSRFVVA